MVMKLPYSDGMGSAGLFGGGPGKCVVRTVCTLQRSAGEITTCVMSF